MTLAAERRGEAKSALHQTVASLIPDWPTLDAEERVRVAARCGDLVMRQLMLAPFYTRLGFHLLFFAWRIFRLLRLQVGRSRPACERALRSFSALPLPIVASLERLLRATTLLFYFEQPEVLIALGEETIAARQKRFRTKRSSTEDA